MTDEGGIHGDDFIAEIERRDNYDADIGDELEEIEEADDGGDALPEFEDLLVEKNERDGPLPLDDALDMLEGVFKSRQDRVVSFDLLGDTYPAVVSGHGHLGKAEFEHAREHGFVVVHVKNPDAPANPHPEPVVVLDRIDTEIINE